MHVGPKKAPAAARRMSENKARISHPKINNPFMNVEKKVS